MTETVILVTIAISVVAILGALTLWIVIRMHSWDTTTETRAQRELREREEGKEAWDVLLQVEGQNPEKIAYALQKYHAIDFGTIRYRMIENDNNAKTAWQAFKSACQLNDKNEKAGHVTENEYHSLFRYWGIDASATAFRDRAVFMYEFSQGDPIADLIPSIYRSVLDWLVDDDCNR